MPRATQWLVFSMLLISITIAQLDTRVPPRAFPVPNICVSDHKPFIGNLSWTSPDCPPRALCVPQGDISNGGWHCTCRFSQLLLEDSNTTCVATAASYSFSVFWFAGMVVCARHFSASFVVVRTAKRTGTLQLDTLSIAAVLATATLFWSIWFALFRFVDALWMPLGTEQLVLAGLYSATTAALVFCFLAVLLMFGATMLVTLLNSPFLMASPQTKRRQLLRVRALVFFLCVLGSGSGVLQWIREEVVSSMYLSLFAAITCVLYMLLASQIEKGMILSTVPLAHHAQSSSQNMLRTFHSQSKRIGLCALLIVCVSTTYGFSWVYGRRNVNRVLIEYIYILLSVVYYPTLVWGFQTMASALCQRLERRGGGGGGERCVSLALSVAVLVENSNIERRTTMI